MLLTITAVSLTRESTLQSDRMFDNLAVGLRY